MAKAVKSSKKTEQGASLPTLEEARSVLLLAEQEHLQATQNRLLNLHKNSPQVLLMEGGLQKERQAMALWWAALQHCESPKPGPCGICSSCIQIAAKMHSDVLLYDGRISNTEDEENPGPVRALNKDNTTALKGRIGDTTRSGHKRVVIIDGIEMGRSAAANALLKVLEEPSPTTIFVLLSPQREQLLPTLVSRSWVITLPWPSSRYVSSELLPLEQALADFIHQGRGWWSKTQGKGAVDAPTAAQLLLLCQKRLLPALAGESERVQQELQGPLSSCFFRCSPKAREGIVQIIENAQEALHYNVNPARVLDTFAAELYILCR